MNKNEITLEGMSFDKTETTGQVNLKFKIPGLGHAVSSYTLSAGMPLEKVVLALVGFADKILGIPGEVEEILKQVGRCDCGVKKPRSRKVAPALQQESKMANAKTAKKIAKKAVAKKVAAKKAK